MNQATCSITGSSFLCSCPQTHKGPTCAQQKIPPCEINNPCVAGTCTNDAENEAVCSCPRNRQGINCEIVIGCFSEDFGTLFQVSDRIAFNCSLGTVLAPGSNNVITCGANGEFSGEVPKCVYIQGENGSGSVAAQLSTWEVIKSVKWIMVMFIMSLGVLFSMFGIGFYAFVLAPWNDHSFAKFFKSGLGKVQDGLTILDAEDK